MPFINSGSGGNKVVPFYSGGQVRNPADVKILTSAPSTANVDSPLGTIAINTTTHIAYICVTNTGTTVTWDQLGLPTGTVGSLTGTSGGAITPTAGNINILGTANQIVFTGTSSTLTASLVGPYTPATYTAHGVLIGESTSSIAATAAGSSLQVLQSGGASADPAWSTATFPATTTANQLLYSSATNTVGGLTSANGGVLTTTGAGVPAITQVGTGQVLIGASANAVPVATNMSNALISYVPKFGAVPGCSLKTGAQAVVTINNANVWSYPQYGAYFEEYNTVATQVIAPSVGANGLNIDTMTGANAAACEITEGITALSKNAYTANVSTAFYVKASFNVATLNQVQEVYIGFRKVAAYQATMPAGYTDYAVIGIHGTAGAIETQTQIGSGGNVLTNSTGSIVAVAGTTFTVQVNVSATGAVTYAINGVANTPAAYTFTASTVVVPYIYFQSAAGAHGIMELVSYQCGLV